MNPSTHTTELYWLCEELLSYTDLTGERFDKENALRRLYPMLPLIKELGDTNLISFYEVLENQLESIDFNKEDFAKRVSDLFDYINKKRG